MIASPLMPLRPALSPSMNAAAIKALDYDELSDEPSDELSMEVSAR